MKRKINQWANCSPEVMAFTLSPAAIMYALQDARDDIMELHRLALRVANLNELDAGQLADVIATARRIIE